MPLIISLPTWQLPMPIPVPFPQPAPVPAPAPGPVIPSPSPPSPAPGIPFPVPNPIAVNTGGITGAFADLFRFDLNWRYLAALLFMSLVVNWVEGQDAQLAWMLVGILLLGIALKTPSFAAHLSELRP